MAFDPNSSYAEIATGDSVGYYLQAGVYYRKDNLQVVSSPPAGPSSPTHVTLDSGSVSLTGPITVSNEVEVKNDLNNPLPVAAAARNCVGRQTLDVTTGSVATLTVPNGAVAANIQADGSTISITQDGTTPTATVGSRVDDGMSWYVDTALANVKMIARTAATKVQVCYFDKA